MRFQLKQVLPMALLLTGVLAASSNTDEATTDAASSEATATDDSATATATDESTATGTDDSSATGTDDSSTITTKASKTTATEPTLTWVATTAATTAPDLLSNDGFSLKDNNYIVVSLSVSLLTAAMTFL